MMNVSSNLRCAKISSLFAGGLLWACALAAPVARAEMHVGVSLGVQLPRGAVAVNVGHDRYYEHRGVFYRPGPRGYYVVRPPRGAMVRYVPRNSVRVVVGPRVYYRYDDVYYVETRGGYEVVDAPRTVVVRESAPAPEPAIASDHGYVSAWLGDQEYRFKGGEFFKPTPEGLVWVIAPTGAIMKSLPDGAVSVWHEDIEYFDVDGAMLRKTPDGYKVVMAPWK